MDTFEVWIEIITASTFNWKLFDNLLITTIHIKAKLVNFPIELLKITDCNLKLVSNLCKKYCKTMELKYG